MLTSKVFGRITCSRNGQPSGFHCCTAYPPQSLALALFVVLFAATVFQASGAGATEYIVSNSGSDLNSGLSTNAPLRTIAKGISLLKAGDTLSLRGGMYVEPLSLVGKDGSLNPITIRSYPGEHAYIDGSVPQFRTPNNSDWELASIYDSGARPDEYVSKATFPTGDPVNRGAFLSRNPFTRLITYSNLNDLRADNQTFEQITDPNDSRKAATVVSECSSADTNPQCAFYDDGKRYKPAGFKFPWVYMGPGIHFNTSTGKIHIRLAHTNNAINGLADYVGVTDPRKVAFAISKKSLTTIHIRNAKSVHFRNLSVRFGGEHTVLLEGGSGIVLDHVRVFASSYGIRSSGVTDTTLSHCEVNGGMPTWFFRTDRKNEYLYVDGASVKQNNLGKQTLIALLLGGNADRNTTIFNSEFTNAHDMYVVGTNVAFHHNWINNINDEALVIDGGLTDNLKLHHNVVSKVLSAISLAGECRRDPRDLDCEKRVIGGPRYIYRNLVDLRTPTAGYRPRRIGDKAIWRYGHTFKGNWPDGPYDVFQNTFLVANQDGQASYLHYRDTTGTSPRRVFNNIFVAINPDNAPDRSITFLPSPNFPAATDGNLYFRTGATTAPLLRFLEYRYGGADYHAGSFLNLTELYACLANKAIFCHSKSQYAPGYEANSLSANPLFRRVGADWAFRTTDDLRPAASSPVVGAGVALPSALGQLDTNDLGAARPGIGAYPAGIASLRVGVDSRRSFPAQ